MPDRQIYLKNNGLGKIERKVTLPFFIWFALISTIVSCSFGGIYIFGFAVKGFAWVLQLVAGIIVLLTVRRRWSFPLYLWIPWILLVTIYLLYSEYENAFQRSILMLCPVVVGMASSILIVNEAQLEYFLKVCKKASLFLYAAIAVKAGVLVTGGLPEITGLSPEAMTATLFAALFSVLYICEKRKTDLMYWISMVTLPVLALTRTAVVGVGSTLPLSLAPLKLAKRFIILLILLSLSVALFYTERFQRKMFFSEHGEIWEASFDNPDFRTTGRKYLWNRMKIEIKEDPWFGHGANANEEFIINFTGIKGQPHNDWIRLLYDYGYIGAAFFAFSLLMQMLHAWKMARRTSGEISMLFYAGASSFIPFLMLMYTDNILLYASFYGNLQFTMLGLAYAANRTMLRDAKQSQVQGNDPFGKPRRRVRIRL